LEDEGYRVTYSTFSGRMIWTLNIERQPGKTIE
jgi:hypothetical protein